MSLFISLGGGGGPPPSPTEETSFMDGAFAIFARLVV
jgi:hypothetical protein